MNIKKIFSGMKGSNDPRYRTAKPFEMLLAPATSASKMTFFVMMMMTGYVANAGFGVAVMLTGVLQTVKTWFDGATDPVVAAIFDKVKVGKFGKIRVFLFTGYLIQAISAILMFNVLSGRFTGAAGVVVYIILYFLFVLGYTVMSVGGGTSVGVILTNDPKQRPFMQFIQMVYQYLGPLGITNILNLIVLPRYNNQIDATMLREACFWYCGYALVFTTLSIIGLRKVDTPEVFGKLMSDASGKQKSVKVKDMLAMVKSNKPLRCYMIAGITDKIATNTNSQTIVTTLLNGILIGSYQVANTVSNASTIIGFIFAFIGGVYLARWGVKKATKIMSALCIAINVIVGGICLILGPTGMAQIGEAGVMMYMYMALMMGKSATTMCLNIAEGMMRADVIDYELYRSGNFMPGMVGAVYSFTEKIVASFGATIAAIAVAAIGYTQVMPQLGDEATWSVLWIVELLVFGLPIFGWLANIITMKFYELDKNRMVEIQTEIAEKKKLAKAAMAK